MSPRPARLPPRESCADWPETECDDPLAEVARQFSLALRDAVDGRSMREIARITGVDRVSIASILGGDVWPDLQTIARLELGLDRALWPRFTGRGAPATRPDAE